MTDLKLQNLEYDENHFVITASPSCISVSPSSPLFLSHTQSGDRMVVEETENYFVTKRILFNQQVFYWPFTVLFSQSKSNWRWQIYCLSLWILKDNKVDTLNNVTISPHLDNLYDMNWYEHDMNFWAIRGFVWIWGLEE